MILMEPKQGLTKEDAENVGSIYAKIIKILTLRLP